MCPESHLYRIAQKHDTDKAVHAHYLKNYEEHFSSLIDKNIKLLELGVRNGGSLLLWRDYFQRALVVGLDINAVEVEDDSGRIRTYQGSQQDTQLLDRIAEENAADGFDIIIDDCSHIGVLTRVSFWHLFENHLKSGGLYVVEDWGTGYWDNWVDGVRYKPSSKSFNQTRYRVTRGIARLQQLSFLVKLPLIGRVLRKAKAHLVRSEYKIHGYGMVGFVKELIDELAMPDIGTDLNSPLSSQFREMKIYQSHLFVTKA
jgi:SAM-dependent methyltransferase